MQEIRELYKWLKSSLLTGVSNIYRQIRGGGEGCLFFFFFLRPCGVEMGFSQLILLKTLRCSAWLRSSAFFKIIFYMFLGPHLFFFNCCGKWTKTNKQKKDPEKPGGCAGRGLWAAERSRVRSTGTALPLSLPAHGDCVSWQVLLWFFRPSTANGLYLSVSVCVCTISSRQNFFRCGFSLPTLKGFPLFVGWRLYFGKQ